MEKTIVSSELEYIPSFLKHDVEEFGSQKKLEREEDEPSLKEIRKSEETASESIPKQELELSRQGISEILAGRFIIALSEYGDIFFGRDGLIYTVDFSRGKVDFNIEDGKIVILRTERISQNDKTVKLAIEAATKEL